jgi:predicted nuclease of predicted toxin-antitoxin system
MRLLLDMNVSPAIGEALRQDGHDVVHARDLGLGERPDDAVMAQAVADRRSLITFDLDFGDIAGSAMHADRTGTLLLRLRSPRRAHMLARIRQAIATAGAVLESGAIVLVEDARLRIRQFDADA